MCVGVLRFKRRFLRTRCWRYKWLTGISLAVMISLVKLTLILRTDTTAATALLVASPGDMTCTHLLITKSLTTILFSLYIYLFVSEPNKVTVYALCYSAPPGPARQFTNHPPPSTYYSSEISQDQQPWCAVWLIAKLSPACEPCGQQQLFPTEINRELCQDTPIQDYEDDSKLFWHQPNRLL